MNAKRWVAGAAAILFAVSSVPSFGYALPDTVIEARAVEFGPLDIEGITEDQFHYEIWGSYEWENDEKVNKVAEYAVITGYEGNEPALTVPSEAGGSPVKKIEHEAFGGKEFLTSVTIPEGVTELEGYVFWNSYNLNTVKLPDSLHTLGESCFSGCTSLVSLVLPDHLQSIGENAFENCSGLVGIDIPDSVTSIGDGAFSKCTSLVKLKLPDELGTINDSVFSGCEKLASLTIPDSVLVIKDAAFYGCAALTKIVIPDSVMKIGGSAFENCTNVTSIQLSNNLTSIPGWCFAFCPNVQEITIPDNVSSIGEWAFSDCTALSHVDFPSALTVIGEGAFHGCGFKELTIPAIDVINSNAFSDNYNLTSVTIPDTVQKIGVEAFANCPKVNSITIPKTVDIIEEGSIGCNGDGNPQENFTVYGYAGTAAETYAEEYGFTFVDLDLATEPTPGDLNSDSTLDLTDLILFQKYLLAVEPLTADQLSVADFDGDGVCDVYDLALMKWALLS